MRDAIENPHSWACVPKNFNWGNRLVGSVLDITQKLVIFVSLQLVVLVSIYTNLLPEYKQNLKLMNFTFYIHQIMYL